MAQFNKVFTTVELAIGGYARARITMADQLQYERSARANGWSKDDQGVANAFLSWHALKRTGQLSCSWDEFADVAVDLDISKETIDIDADGEDQAAGGFTR